MYVLRIYLRSGPQVELLYRAKGDVRQAVHTLEGSDIPNARVRLSDDFGKDIDLRRDAIEGWQPSDYAAELDGALAISRAKQEANEKFQREMQTRHSLMVPTGPGNGRMVLG